MRHLGICILLVSLSHLTMAQEKPTEDGDRRPTNAVRSTIASYVAAFNAGDAERVAAHWTERGELRAPGRPTVHGRAAIQQAFVEYFDEYPGARLEIARPQLRKVTESVVVEEGVARVVRPADATILDTPYMAVHVRSDDGWKMDSVREMAAGEVAPVRSHYNELKSLEWFIGRWADQDETGVVHDCRWTKNRNFITRRFRSRAKDANALEGTQMIGWDPHTQTIRSWLFDTDGTIGEATWSIDGREIRIEAQQTLPDGGLATATNIVTIIDDDTFTWQSTNRVVNGERLDDVDALIVERLGEKK